MLFVFWKYFERKYNIHLRQCLFSYSIRTCFRGFRKFGEETRVWRTMNAKKFYSFWGRVN